MCCWDFGFRVGFCYGFLRFLDFAQDLQGFFLLGFRFSRRLCKGFCRVLVFAQVLHLFLVGVWFSRRFRNGLKCFFGLGAGFARVLGGLWVFAQVLQRFLVGCWFSRRFCSVFLFGFFGFRESFACVFFVFFFVFASVLQGFFVVLVGFWFSLRFCKVFWWGVGFRAGFAWVLVGF